MATLQEKKDEAKAKGVKILRSDNTVAKISTKIKAHEDRELLKTGVVSNEQIEQWKSKYGGVSEISIEVAEGDTAVGYLRKPNRDHKAVSVTLYNQDKLLECGEFLLQNCWLGGDERLKDDEKVSDSAAMQATNIVNFLKGSSREL